MRLTSEEREALQAYREQAYKPGHFGEHEYRNVGYLTGSDGWNHRAALANLCVRLLERAVDDETPVDEAWLRSVGFKQWKDDDIWRLKELSLDLMWTDGIPSVQFEKRIAITRGDVCRLCAALGSELKEPTNDPR